ncbi:hypothetical protein [Bradyrhizobium stylosanthis]|nr:hypothetical protein [Bradyrhizobium stylosanthis]
MGIGKNLWLMAKTAGGRRALSRPDLFAYCESMIRQPPAPAELVRAMQDRHVRWEGVQISLVEYYRRHYLTPALERTASEPTWERQRATCLREILNEAHWANWEYCFKQARTPLGKEIILQKLRQLWPDRTIEELQHYVLQFYLVALCTNAVLTTVGKSFYKFDEATELQIKLYGQYGRDIYMLEIGIMDLAHDVFADDEAHAYEIATFKDERVAPLVQDMFRHLTTTKEQIIERTFDIAEFKRVDESIGRQKAALAAELTSNAP